MVGRLKTTREFRHVYVRGWTWGAMDSIHVFSDAMFDGGSVTFMKGNLMIWKSTRHTIVTT